MNMHATQRNGFDSFREEGFAAGAITIVWTPSVAVLYYCHHYNQENKNSIYIYIKYYESCLEKERLCHFVSYYHH